jgi:predicted DNA-binding transcriptional regulator AlpA
MKHQAREERKAEVIGIWEKHYPNITVAEVVRRTGFGERVIYQYLREAGLPLPQKRSRRVDMKQVRRAHRLFEKHGSKAEVARRMNISRQRVGYYLKKNPNG